MPDTVGFIIFSVLILVPVICGTVYWMYSRGLEHKKEMALIATGQWPSAVEDDEL